MNVLQRAKNRIRILHKFENNYVSSYTYKKINRLNTCSSFRSNYFKSIAFPLPCVILFSTSPSSSKTTSTNEDNNKKKTQLLYKSSSALIPRGFVSLSSLNFVYWLWYVLDFMPTAINSQLDVYPELGYTGFVVSVGVFIGSCLYPRYLISEVTMTKPNKQLPTYHVKLHALPFCNVDEKAIKTKSMQLIHKEFVTEDLNEHIFLNVKVDNDGGTSKDTKFLMHVKPNELQQLDIWKKI